MLVAGLICMTSNTSSNSLIYYTPILLLKSIDISFIVDHVLAFAIVPKRLTNSRIILSILSKMKNNNMVLFVDCNLFLLSAYINSGNA